MISNDVHVLRRVGQAVHDVAFFPVDWMSKVRVRFPQATHQRLPPAPARQHPSALHTSQGQHQTAVYTLCAVFYLLCGLLLAQDFLCGLRGEEACGVLAWHPCFAMPLVLVAVFGSVHSALVRPCLSADGGLALPAPDQDVLPHGESQQRSGAVREEALLRRLKALQRHHRRIFGEAPSPAALASIPRPPASVCRRHPRAHEAWNDVALGLAAVLPAAARLPEVVEGSSPEHSPALQPRGGAAAPTPPALPLPGAVSPPAPHDGPTPRRRASRGVRNFNRALQSITSRSCPDIAGLAGRQGRGASPRRAVRQLSDSAGGLASPSLWGIGGAPEEDDEDGGSVGPLGAALASLAESEHRKAASGTHLASGWTQLPPRTASPPVVLGGPALGLSHPSTLASLRAAGVHGAFLGLPHTVPLVLPLPTPRSDGGSAAERPHVAATTTDPPVATPAQSLPSAPRKAATLPPAAWDYVKVRLGPGQAPKQPMSLGQLAFSVVASASEEVSRDTGKHSRGATLVSGACLALLPLLPPLLAATQTVPTPAHCQAHTLQEWLSKPGVLLGCRARLVVVAAAAVPAGLVQALVQGPDAVGWSRCVLAGGALVMTGVCWVAALRLLRYMRKHMATRLAVASRFSSLTTPSAAQAPATPHFRLHKISHAKMWLALRAVLRSSAGLCDVQGAVWRLMLVSTALVLSVAAVMGGEGEEASHADPVLLCIVLAACLAGWNTSHLISTAYHITSAFRGTGVLITAQMNVALRQARAPHKKGELTVVASFLKSTEALLKELEHPGQLSVLGLDAPRYNILRLCVLSAVTAMVSRVLGVNVRLWKMFSLKG